MEKQKHTPGPWLVDQGLSNKCDVTIVAGARNVAQVLHLRHAKDNEALANADLIAAAPDMLKALKLARKRLEEFLPHMVRD